MSGTNNDQQSQSDENDDYCGASAGAIGTAGTSNASKASNASNDSNTLNTLIKDDDPSSFYAKAYETYDANGNATSHNSTEDEANGDEQDMYVLNYSDDSNCHTITFDDENEEHMRSLTNINLQDDYEHDNEDNDALLVVNTVALNYDMGITNETKVCCSLCRRSRLFQFISKKCRRCLAGVCCCSSPSGGPTCTLCCCRNSKSQNRSHNNKLNHDDFDGDDDDDEGLHDKPSNEELLSMAFLTFLTFTIAQLIAAYFAKSEAMMGDSAAMGVDAFTYGFNLVAEQLKNKVNQQQQQQQQKFTMSIHNGNIDNQQQQQQQMNEQKLLLIQERRNRKYKLCLELVPPIISVTTLIAVTIVILKQSIQVLILDSTRDVVDQSNPNIIIMFTFSVVNLFVDIVNVCFFASANHAFGYDTMDVNDEEVYERDEQVNPTNNNNDNEVDWNDYDNDCDDTCYKEQTIELVEQRKMSNLDKPKATKKNQTKPMMKDVHRARRRKERITVGTYSHLSSNATDDECIQNHVQDNESEDQIHQSHFVEKRNLNMVSTVQ